MAAPKAERARKQIAQTLRGRPDAAAAEVAQTLGCSRSLVDAVRAELVAAGEIPPLKRRRDHGGQALCAACGGRGYRSAGLPAPNGWDVDPLRCSACVRGGRLPAPVSVRHVQPWSLKTAVGS